MWTVRFIYESYSPGHKIGPHYKHVPSADDEYICNTYSITVRGVVLRQKLRGSMALDVIPITPLDEQAPPQSETRQHHNRHHSNRLLPD